MNTETKEEVYVRQYPGKPVFDQYHGVPAEEYIQKAGEAFAAFLEKHSCKKYFVKTLTSSIKYDHDSMHASVDTKKEEIAINGHSINPTKWGTDEVAPGLHRIWFFDQITLKEVNVECASWRKN